tara:strand:+ start:2226 stop:3281 length:1056 start_codon:yes stop_codon:yes gene_type:complete
MSVALNDYKVFFVAQSSNGGLYTLNSPTQLTTAADDEYTSSNIAFPWSFPFSTGSYSHFNVDVNGHVALTKASDSTTSALAYTNTAIQTGHNTNILAPWWDDLETAHTDGYVKYEIQTGVSPQRVVVEWHIVGHFGHDATNYTKAKMQCVMKENGNIEFRYGDLTVGGTGGSRFTSATIGVKQNTMPGTSGNIRGMSWFAAGGAQASGTPIGSETTLRTDLVMSSSVPQGQVSWPGSNDNVSPLSASYNILFIRDESESFASAAGNAGPAGGHPVADGDFVINLHQNVHNEWSSTSPTGGTEIVDAGSGPIESAALPKLPQALSVKGPISLRSRGKAYSVSSGGDPDQTTT